MTTVTLSKPVTFEKKTINQLTLREPVVGDVVKTDLVTGEMMKNVALLAAITDTNIPVISALSLSDFKRLTEAAAPFLAAVADDAPADQTQMNPA